MDYLRKHKPVVFTTIIAQGKLRQYLADIGAQARKMFDALVEQTKNIGFIVHISSLFYETSHCFAMSQIIFVAIFLYQLLITL